MTDAKWLSEVRISEMLAQCESENGYPDQDTMHDMIKALAASHAALAERLTACEAQLTGFPNLSAMRQCMIETADQNKQLTADLATVAAEREQWKASAQDWATAADAAIQPEAFYGKYDEKPMRAMQALLTKAKADLARVTAERDKALRYPFESICLLCGKLEPCMTDEQGAANGGPGRPCTFDRTPKQMHEWNTRLRAERDTLKAENTRLRGLLEVLTAMVKGECPSLLNEDSGGNARLALDIEAALASGLPPRGGFSSEEQQ